MPVRGTTHAIHNKVIINHDRGGTHVMCGWDTCTNDGYESNKVRVNEAAPGYDPKYISYVFCTERHRNYFVDQLKPGLWAGKLASGNRSGLL
jgi:hypothetical protein